jgi:hypothetical protein
MICAIDKDEGLVNDLHRETEPKFVGDFGLLRPPPRLYTSFLVGQNHTAQFFGFLRAWEYLAYRLEK